jgi:hypothetical protein
VHIERVKKYVLASLLCSVLMLHSLAVATLGAWGDGARGSRPGLFVVSALLGLFGVVGVRLLNQRSVMTPWLATCLVIPLIVYVGYFKVLH